MKTLIIYFSQTGNTFSVAEEIRQGIVADSKDCDLVELQNVIPAVLETDDLVGLGCPVFYYQEPLNVREFIEALPKMPGERHRHRS